MAKSKVTTELSVIAILFAKRDAVYTRADADGFRTLTEAEHIEMDALGTVIATAEATDRSDALVQIAEAKGIIELVRDGYVEPERLDLAHAALTSAVRALETPNRRGAS